MGGVVSGAASGTDVSSVELSTAESVLASGRGATLQLSADV
jgi:hypothetical protein